MNRTTRLLVPVLATALLGGAAVGALGLSSVHAASDAPWQSASAKSPHAVGTITLYNAQGQPVTSGDVAEPLAAYAVGSGGLRSGDTVASLALYTPIAASGTPAPADAWSGAVIAKPTTQSGLPAFATGPSVDLAGSVPLSQYLGGFTNTVSDSVYQGAYELRLTTGAAGRAFSPTYNVVDLQVSNGQWHLYGEGGPQAAATTTTVAVAPTGGKAGQALTLTATVAPVAAGTVQFKVGAASVGSAVEVDSTSGKATISYTPTRSGAISVSASFTPADSSAFAPSTATPVTYAVGASAACAGATTAAAAATTALSAATKALAAAKAALSKATTAKVKAYLKAEAKVATAKAKVKAATSAAAKKKAKKSLTAAKKALTKAKKKAGSAVKTYTKALAGQKAAAAAQAAKAKASATAQSAKAAACK